MKCGLQDLIEIEKIAITSSIYAVHVLQMQVVTRTVRQINPNGYWQGNGEIGKAYVLRKLFTLATTLGEFVIAKRSKPETLADQVGIDSEAVP